MISIAGGTVSGPTSARRCCPSGLVLGKYFFRESFVNDYGLRGIFSVAPIEDATGQQRNVHGAKIIRSHDKI